MSIVDRQFYQIEVGAEGYKIAPDPLFP